jgi:tRNA (cytosine38-C5)-methyltransferase
MAADGPITALEFYSGIGGMRYALDAAAGERGHRVLAAFDLNPVANAVYQHNFGDRPVQGNLGARPLSIAGLLQRPTARQ